MTEIQGYFDGTAIRPLERMDVKLNQRVIITVMDDFVEPAKTGTGKGMRGVLSDYADPALREQEKGAWERTAVKKYGSA